MLQSQNNKLPIDLSGSESMPVGFGQSPILGANLANMQKLQEKKQIHSNRISSNPNKAHMSQKKR